MASAISTMTSAAAGPRAPSGRDAPRIHQGRGRVLDADAEGGDHREEHRRQQRDAAGEGQHGAVDADGRELRQVDRRRHQRDQRGRGPARQEHADRPGERGEHQAFGQRLPDEPRALRPERDAQGHLLPPSDGAGHEQVGNVHARDQQHDRHRAEQQQKGRPGLANHRGAQRARAVVGALVRRRVLPLHLARERRELHVRLLRRHARLEARDSEHPAALPFGRRGRRQPHRDDDVGLRIGREAEARRRDADDLPQRRTEVDRPADHPRVAAESLLPGVVAEDRHEAAPSRVSSADSERPATGRVRSASSRSGVTCSMTTSNGSP